MDTGTGADHPDARLGEEKNRSLGKNTEEELSGREADLTKGNASSKKEHAGAWIRYRVEYRERYTDDLIYSQESKKSDFDDQRRTDPSGADEWLVEESILEGPVFEIVTVHRTKQSLLDPTTPVTAPPPVIMTAPSIRMRIQSNAIINALQSVVQYYPGQDLTGDTIMVNYPYPILVHHYEELSEFREKCSAKEPGNLCAREKDAYEHLGLLLQYLNKTIMPDVEAEKERNKEGRHTFEWMWVLLKPGTTLLTQASEATDWVSVVVHSVSRGAFDNPPTPWVFTFWNLAYDGTYLGRRYHFENMHKFDGEAEFSDNMRIVDIKNLEDPKDEVKKLLGYGERYWKLLRKKCMYYRGKTENFPYNEVDGLVMVDIGSYYADRPEAKPILMDKTDCRNWISDCVCSVCKRTRTKDKKIEALFEDYNLITLETWDGLEPHQYLLCPPYMPAFVFRTRAWETLHLNHFSEPKFEENMIDSLVMDQRRVDTLKALAKSFARINRHGQKAERPPWTADFVKGKGHGLIFLLHGKPGVGKTCTAECIAEFTKRPLMVLTCSDIGTDPQTVEVNLTKNFKTARSWDAVLLIDEADVFMERRSTADLTRNSLVAGFLRALEFYDGILFLTTNRVGSFDDAFISRVHVQLYYPDFTDDERRQVWKTFVNKLAKERGDYMRLNIDAREYLTGKEMRAIKWNGREIRNAFQTAVALAEYDAEKDEEGKIMLTDKHLRSVVELSRDFKDYLNALHKGDEGKRAERKFERLDTFDRNS